MPKIKEIQVQGYFFTDVPELYWHSGKFWFNEKEVKKVYNNGSLSLLLYGTTKKSVAKLRRTAKKCNIIIYRQKLPF